MEKKKKIKISKEESIKEFEELLSKKPKNVECRVAEVERNGKETEEVICNLKFPWQKKGVGEATLAIVEPIKIQHLKEVKIKEVKK